MLENGLSPISSQLMRGMGMDPEQMVQNMRAGIQQAKQAQHTPVTVHYFHCDHLGTPIALTDQEGNIVWAARHDPWGNIEEEYNPHGMEQNIRMPGQYLDRETGLYYNLHRYYDPRVGAYINQDPIGLDGDMNLYGYAIQNPLSYSDPHGLLFMSTIGGLQRGVTLMEAATYGAPGTAALAAGLTTAAAGGTAAVATEFNLWGYALGLEFKIGKNLRMAPWGNRTENTLGKCPHYHRRGTPDSAGNTPPGQGIGRHRPWEKKSTDTSVFDRF